MHFKLISITIFFSFLSDNQNFEDLLKIRRRQTFTFIDLRFKRTARTSYLQGFKAIWVHL